MTIDFGASWWSEQGNIRFDGPCEGSSHIQVLRFLKSWKDSISMMEVHTSGSTGAPKAIDIPKDWMKESAIRTLSQLQIPEEGRALLCISPFHIGGMMMIVRAIVHRLKLTVLPPSSLPLTDELFDFTAMVPLQVQRLLEHGVKLDGYGTLIIGGSAVSPQLESALKHQEQPIYATFGMTETVSNIALRRLNGKGSDSFFHCHPGIEVNEEANGHLRIRIPYMDGLDLITNDLVEVLDDATFRWKGRADGVINSGGVKLIPEEIERKLSDVLPVEYFISSTEDDVLGQKVVLVIEHETLPQAWLEKIDAQLTSYERPRAVYCCTELQRTATGKIRKEPSLQSAYLAWSKEDGVNGRTGD